MKMHQQIALKATMVIVAGIATAAGLISTPAMAQVRESEMLRAQGDMLRRVGTDVDAYARKIGLSESYSSFCHTQLSLDTRHEQDGSVPFGVNYHSFKDAKELEIAIFAREAYERSYLILCLARAKASLREAERP
jgi:hypothetical protein